MSETTKVPAVPVDRGNGPAEPLIEQAFVRVKPCRYGTLLYNWKDTYVGRSLDFYGEFSEGEVRMFDQILKPGMVAVDVGANIGCHTVFMAQKVSPGGAVFAYEPQRVVHQMLCANLALNALTNVKATHAAAGAEAGEIIVPNIEYGAGGNIGGVELGSHTEGETIAVVPIDQLQLSVCHLIKVDVEGMEKDVIAGAAATIGRCRPFLYVENDRRDRSSQLIKRLFGLDYRLYWHLPRLFNSGNFFGQETNVFGDLISRNMVCVPKENNITIEAMEEITSPDITFGAVLAKDVFVSNSPMSLIG